MTQSVVSELLDLLQKVHPEDYCKPCNTLSNFSIGQHIRHSIEMYHCVIDGYLQSSVDYDARKRDPELDTNIQKAVNSLNYILQNIQKSDKPYNVFSNGNSCVSSFEREILYCNEHLIHHMALVRIGINELGNYHLSESFGVAPSTIQYQKECVQ